MITMLIDHIGACVFERGLLLVDETRNDAALFEMLRNTDRILRLIGRVSFPIFCFLLVEGFLHTHDRKNMHSAFFCLHWSRKSLLILRSWDVSLIQYTKTSFSPC